MVWNVNMFQFRLLATEVAKHFNQESETVLYYLGVCIGFSFRQNLKPSKSLEGFKDQVARGNKGRVSNNVDSRYRVIFVDESSRICIKLSADAQSNATQVVIL